MKTINFFAAMTLFAFTFVACSQSDDDANEKVKGIAKVTLNISSPSSTRGIDGEEIGTDAENNIKSVEFYVFNSDGTVDKEVGRPAANVDGTGYIKVTALSKNYVINITAGNDKKFVAVINQNLKAVGSYKELKSKLSDGKFIATNEKENNSRIIPANGFEMSGEATQSVAKEANTPVTIKVSRLVSKVNPLTLSKDFKMEIDPKEIDKLWGKDSGITNDMITFKCDGYALINGIDKSHEFFIGTTTGLDIDVNGNVSWPNWIRGDKVNLVSGFNGKEYKNTYSGYDENNKTWFLSTDNVYVYENKPNEITVDGTKGWDPKSVYAFIIKGDLIVDKHTTQTRYWRLNLIKDNNYHVLRNCVYKVSVKSITNIGQDTPKDAEEVVPVIPFPDATSVTADIEVLKWRINIYNTDI